MREGNPDSPTRRDRLTIRSRVLQAVRRFFTDRDFLEVETPVRLAAPALELHIDAEPSGHAYLRTSPELHMKRLLAEGVPRCFQMGPCFRRGEVGRLHQPEYTMLEWYRAEAGYRDVLADARALLVDVAREVLGRPTIEFRGETINLDAAWHCITVRQAFLDAAGWDPFEAFDADRFDLDLVEKVEPSLPRERPAVLIDYPAPLAALARCRAETPPVAERWELYIGKVELANAFGELTDPAEQRRRFEACAEARRRLDKPVYPLDEAFLAALETGLPDCAGVALGIDRLTMLLADADSVSEVQAFPEFTCRKASPIVGDIQAVRRDR